MPRYTQEVKDKAMAALRASPGYGELAEQNKMLRRIAVLTWLATRATHPDRTFMWMGDYINAVVDAYKMGISNEQIETAWQYGYEMANHIGRIA